MTRSQIDMVWALPMPIGLGALALSTRIVSKGLKRGAADVHFGDFAAHVAVVAFELENDAKKHGAGALLNLGSHAMAGVFVAGSKSTARTARSMHATYATHYPLSRVTVNEEFAHE